MKFEGSVAVLESAQLIFCFISIYLSVNFSVNIVWVFLTMCGKQKQINGALFNTATFPKFDE